jgi:beta-galactosidase
MIERACDAAVQAKLAAYVREGGRLALVGRLCQEDFHGRPCPLLAEALGITRIGGGEPFHTESITAFGYTDVPASFVEVYEGDFAEVVATRADGGIVGFVQRVGRGQALVFGASLAATTLDDLGIVWRLAERLGCPSLFTLSDWLDVRLSVGPNGRFLFLNNYQDDPITTTVALAGHPLFDGHAITVPPRRGFILPLEWHPRPGVLIHYLTAEPVERREEDGRLLLRTDPPEFLASVSLRGYCVEEALIRGRGEDGRLHLHGREGVLVLTAC